MMSLENVVVVIPAAGFTKDVYGNQTTYPACLKVIDGKPLIYWIIHDLHSKGLNHFVIGVRPSYVKLVQNSIFAFAEIDVTVHPIFESNNELDTIRQLAAFGFDNKSILINLGDTFCTFELSSFMNHKISVIYGHREESLRWVSIDIDKNQEITNFYPKGMDSIGAKIKVLSGVFWWKDFETFSGAMLTGATEIAQSLTQNQEKIFALQADSWIDSDHSDIFEDAKKSGIQARHFNSIEIDSNKGTITKRSKNVAKLSAEIFYYNHIPDDLKVIFPRMLGSSIREDLAEQTLEYYPMRTLSEIFTQENLPIFVWQKIFRRLHDITFQKFPLNNIEMEVQLLEFFLEKIAERNIELSKSNQFEPNLLTAKEIVINGEKLKGISWIMEQSAWILRRINTAESMVHGDFCFSNILTDLDTGIFKLIDPRGGFGSESIYGPRIYDVAKLAHSVLGKYDFLISGQFRLTGSFPAYNLSIAEPEHYKDILTMFVTEYLQNYYSLEEIRLLSSLILVSIPLLHMDEPHRATALILNGIKDANLAIGRLINEA
jgi:hypothetical protein